MSTGIREFETGANRNSDDGKLDYEGFFSPAVMVRYAQYMHKNRFLVNGDMRDSDNWQKGIPRKVYMKSGYRHFMDWWLEHRGYTGREGVEEALCGLIFNAMGYLHEVLKEEKREKDDSDVVNVYASGFCAGMRAKVSAGGDPN